VFSVGRITRRRDPGVGGLAAGTTAVMTPVDDAVHLPGTRRSRLTSIRQVGRFGAVPGERSSSAAQLPVPVSPAVGTSADAAPRQLTIPLLPGERTIARRVRFAIVNACTIMSLLLGLSAVFLVVSSDNVRLAAALLVGCVVFDGLDGALARRLGVASPFGAQMDSLADMCSFGIAAPVVVYGWLASVAPKLWVAPACALVGVCAAIRLARFNVSPKDGRFFCGVPTTMAAAVLALATLIETNIPIGLRVAGVAVLALAMVSSFPYAKLARLLRLPPWLLVIPVIGALIDHQLTFAVVVLTYLASGPVIWMRQRGSATAVPA
jgi:CDP-diacylglycerol--serine O-phosphatidyltransferase